MGAVPEEIRLRVGSPVCLRDFEREHYFGANLTKEQLVWVVGNAAEGSFHTAAGYLQKGYIPLRCGSRMGVCGNGTNGEITSFGDVSSACIRIARSAEGCADELYDTLYEDGFRNTIIIAPPGVGKTTLLRELIRKCSYGGMYVGVADERGEIAGMYGDRSSFDLGPRSDVLSGIPKSRGAMLLLRSMTPDLLAMDEITAHSDMETIMEAAGCGAGLLTTIHGEGTSVFRKPAFRQLYELGVFRYGILINVNDGKRSYKAVDLDDEILRSGAYIGSGDNARLAATGENESAVASAGRIYR